MNRRRFGAMVLSLPLFALVACKEPPPAQLAGKWQTTYDDKTRAEATLTQTGNKVTGSYSGEANKGTVEGTVSGSIVTGTWTEGDTPAAKGTFRWSMDADGNRFTGTYESEDKKHAGKWNGVKL